MSQIDREGLRVRVPAGWDARLVGRDARQFQRGDHGQVVAAAVPTRTAVLQLATFPLPDDVGDFGGGAVDLMRRTDVFVVVFEFGPESAGTALFAGEGVPRLRPDDFDPATLRKALRGQSAVQRFFVLNGRPMCLYAVLGSHARRIGLVPLVNDLLASLQAEPR